MNSSNLPPIRKIGPAIAPKPKNIKIHAGRATINFSSDSASRPVITITRNQNVPYTNNNYEDDKQIVYNIPIQHVPSNSSNSPRDYSQLQSLNNNNNLINTNNNKFNDLNSNISIDTSPKTTNFLLSTKNNSNIKPLINNTVIKPSVDEQIDLMQELLMKNLIGSKDPTFQGICMKCGENIVGVDSGLKAMDQLYHIKCFTCISCYGSLKDKHFYAMDNKSYCESCYIKLLEECCICSKPITDRILRATGKPYHPECFCCTVCKNNLDGVPFTVDATNKIHCIDCFHNKYAPRCYMCQLPITPEIGQEETTRIVAMDKSFHVNCYKCEDCGVSLSSSAERAGGCYPLDDHIFCKNCNLQRLRNIKGISPQTLSTSNLLTPRSTDL